jgi:hypothetical protein
MGDDVSSEGDGLRFIESPTVDDFVRVSELFSGGRTKGLRPNRIRAEFTLKNKSKLSTIPPTVSYLADVGAIQGWEDRWVFLQPGLSYQGNHCRSPGVHIGLRDTERMNLKLRGAKMEFQLVAGVENLPYSKLARTNYLREFGKEVLPIFDRQGYELINFIAVRDLEEDVEGDLFDIPDFGEARFRSRLVYSEDSGSLSLVICEGEEAYGYESAWEAFQGRP